MNNIWAVGSTFGKTDDVSAKFLKDGIWYDGYAEDGDYRYKDILSKITVGDILVMKSSSTKGPGRKISFTKVKAVGRVKEKVSFYKFLIDWFSVDGLPLDFEGIWYSQTIEAIREDSIKSFVIKINSMNYLKTIQDLLIFKKQIILQGPPGTGKTRLAKEIAAQLIKVNSVSDEDILETVYSNLLINDPKLSETLKVVSINEDTIRVSTTNSGKDYPVFLREIKNYISEAPWAETPDSKIVGYKEALSWHVFRKLQEKQIKLLQFHPAYSYDDFVRGIVADTSDGIVSYRSINKVFGELAQNAWKNYQDSRKTSDQVSQEQIVDKYMELFRDFLEGEIEGNQGKLFLDGTTTYLFQVEDDAVRYTGDNWKLVTGQRLLFSDIKTLFIAGANSRQAIKVNTNVSGLAKHHASYFLKVLDLFKGFVKGIDINQSEIPPIEEHAYVLIIDEINRANLPSVLGELIYGLEYRGELVESMYEVDGSRSMVVPPNLFIIGTLNTADRSVGHIDYAIRRRFAFVEVLPSISPIKNGLAKVYFEKVSKLFVSNYDEVISSNGIPENSTCLASDFKPEEVWIGHSYFITGKEGEAGNTEIRTKMRYEVLPLVKEYVKDGILIMDPSNSEDLVLEVINELSRL